MMEEARIREALECARHGCSCQKPKGLTHCPVPSHVDDNPSCSLKEGEGGRILVHCHAGCPQEEVWRALGLGDERSASAPPPEEPPAEGSHGGQRYWYIDADWNKLFCVERYYDSGGRKRFMQYHMCGGSLEPGMGGDCGCSDVPRVLYNLPNVIQHDQVFWVEGEKDVQTLVRHNAVATCTPQGSAAFDRCMVSNPNLLEPLQGKEVFVVADNDAPGARYAREVAERLTHYASKVWTLSFGTDFDQGFDVSDLLADSDVDFKDWVRRHRVLAYDADAAEQVVDLLPPYHVDEVGDLSMVFPQDGATEHIELVASHIDPVKDEVVAKIKAMKVTTASGRKSTLLPVMRVNLTNTTQRKNLVDALTKRRSDDTWMDRVDKLTIAIAKQIESFGKVVDVKYVETALGKRNWLLEPIIEHDEHIALYAQGGVGKSLLAGSFVMSLAAGQESIAGVRPKATAIPTLYLDWEDTDQAYASRLQRIARGMGIEMPEGCKYMQMQYPFSDAIDHVRREIDKHGIELVVIDSVGVACGNINNVTEATKYQRMVNALGCAVISITHVSKGGMADKDEPMPIGSVYFMNGPRASFFLAGDHNAEITSKEQVLIQTKSNSGPFAPPLGFKTTFDNEAATISFARYPQFMENAKLRAYCKPVDVLEYYLWHVYKTPEELRDHIPEYTFKRIVYTLNSYRDKRFRELDGQWTAIVE